MFFSFLFSSFLFISVLSFLSTFSLTYIHYIHTLHTCIHTCIHTYIYSYMHVCVCVCVCVFIENLPNSIRKAKNLDGSNPGTPAQRGDFSRKGWQKEWQAWYELPSRSSPTPGMNFWNRCLLSLQDEDSMWMAVFPVFVPYTIFWMKLQFGSWCRCHEHPDFPE